MLDFFSYYNIIMSKNLTGLVQVDADQIYSGFYEDVSSEAVGYLLGAKSNIQSQIDSINATQTTFDALTASKQVLIVKITSVDGVVVTKKIVY